MFVVDWSYMGQFDYLQASRRHVDFTARVTAQFIRLIGALYPRMPIDDYYGLISFVSHCQNSIIHQLTDSFVILGWS